MVAKKRKDAAKSHSANRALNEQGDGPSASPRNRPGRAGQKLPMIDEKGRLVVFRDPATVLSKPGTAVDRLRKELHTWTPIFNPPEYQLLKEFRSANALRAALVDTTPLGLEWSETAVASEKIRVVGATTELRPVGLARSTPTSLDVGKRVFTPSAVIQARQLSKIAADCIEQAVCLPRDLIGTLWMKSTFASSLRSRFDLGAIPPSPGDVARWPVVAHGSEYYANVEPMPVNPDQAFVMDLFLRCDGDEVRLHQVLKAMFGVGDKIPSQILELSARIERTAEKEPENGSVSPVVIGVDDPKPAPYAVVYCSGGDPMNLSKDGYEALIERRNQYDFFIDGIGCQCFKPNQRGDEQLSERLTPAQVKMIRGFVTKRGVHSPGEFYQGKSVTPLSIIRMFDDARSVVDQKNSDGTFSLLRSHRGITAEERRFEFAPSPEISWIFIDLK